MTITPITPPAPLDIEELAAVCAACGDTRANHELHHPDECQAFRDGVEAPALSPEERAERAWEIESARQKLYSANQGAIFKAGYLAGLKDSK